MLISKQSVVSISVLLLTLAGVIGILVVNTVSAEVAYYVSPTAATGIIFGIFSILLKWRIGDNLFAELGFLYLALTVAYTVIPALSFLGIGLDASNPLAQLLPAPSELGIHLWRHVLFVFGVAAGYLLVRGRRSLQLITMKDPRGRDGLTIHFLIGMTLVIIVFLSVMSAPVASYYDHYIRYDHLSWFSRKLVSVFVRLNFGIYTVLLVFLFLNYKKYRLVIPVIVTTICLYETVYSFGSRIYTLVILLGTAWLYHLTVRPITLRKGMIIGVSLIWLFSVVEIVRISDFNLNSAQDVLLEEGIKPPSELGAVFLTGFHLYKERTDGALPPTEWPMFFADFISLVTFGAFRRWNPMGWYARNYYPDAVVPPLTLGPIADSAIWGGEADLLLRGLINGAFFAWLVRWFLRRRNTWWGVTIYVYCYASSVMTLKYSVFYILTPLLKTLLPTLLLVGVFRELIPSRKRSSFPNRALVRKVSR